MKKFLFSLVAILSLTAFSANAQIISYSQTKITEVKRDIPPVKIGFQQAIELQIRPHVWGEMDTPVMAIVNYIAGYRFNNTVFVGGGIGGGVIDAHIFANAKFYMTNTRIQPFGEVSIGGGLWGAQASVQIGVNIRTQTRLNYFFCTWSNRKFLCFST